METVTMRTWLGVAYLASEQTELRSKVVEKDAFSWTLSGENRLKLIGGMDISFVKVAN